MRISDFLPLVPLRFVSFARRYRDAHLGSLPLGTGAAPKGLELVSRYPTGIVRGSDKTSQVPGEPQCTHAPLFDPGGTSTPGQSGVSVLPSVTGKTSAPAASPISGLNDAAYVLTVYAPQGESPHHHVRLVSGWWPTVAGWEWIPTGFHHEVSELSGHLIPLIQALPGAIQDWTLRVVPRDLAL